MFKITGTAHTGITVTSMDDALAFWVGVLGFKLRSKEDFGPSPFLDNVVGVVGSAATLAVVEGPGHAIELLEYHAPADKTIYRPRSCDVGSVHVALLVEDIDGVMEACAKAEWYHLGEIQTVQDGPRKGLRLMYVRGPDGVTVEFLQPAFDGAPY